MLYWCARFFVGVVVQLFCSPVVVRWFRCVTIWSSFVVLQSHHHHPERNHSRFAQYEKKTNPSGEVGGTSIPLPEVKWQFGPNKFMKMDSAINGYPWWSSAPTFQFSSGANIEASGELAGANVNKEQIVLHIWLDNWSHGTGLMISIPHKSFLTDMYHHNVFIHKRNAFFITHKHIGRVTKSKSGLSQKVGRCM